MSRLPIPWNTGFPLTRHGFVIQIPASAEDAFFPYFRIGVGVTRLARLFKHPPVPLEPFTRWASQQPGVHPVHHYHALCALWPLLNSRSHKILDIGPDPIPWLQTIAHFTGTRHSLFACRQGGPADGLSRPPDNITVLPAEFDVWSPLAHRDVPNMLAEKGFTVVTALQVVDHLYHPDTLFRVLSQVMSPRGILLITASNVARLGNLLHLLGGGGLAGDLDALVGRTGPDRPRPRVREYCWQELNGAIIKAGFQTLDHSFYDDPADAPAESPFTETLRQAIASYVREPEQLHSELVLVYRKSGHRWFIRLIYPVAYPLYYYGRKLLGKPPLPR